MSASCSVVGIPSGRGDRPVAPTTYGFSSISSIRRSNRKDHGGSAAHDLLLVRIIHRKFDTHQSPALTFAAASDPGARNQILAYAHGAVEGQLLPEMDRTGGQAGALEEGVDGQRAYGDGRDYIAQGSAGPVLRRLDVLPQPLPGKPEMPRRQLQPSQRPAGPLRPNRQQRRCP